MLDRLPRDVLRIVCAFATADNNDDDEQYAYERLLCRARQLASTCRAVRAVCDSGKRWCERARRRLDDELMRCIDGYYATRRLFVYVRCGAEWRITSNRVTLVGLPQLARDHIDEFWQRLCRTLRITTPSPPSCPRGMFIEYPRRADDTGAATSSIAVMMPYDQRPSWVVAQTDPPTMLHDATQTDVIRAMLAAVVATCEPDETRRVDYARWQWVPSPPVALAV